MPTDYKQSATDAQKRWVAAKDSSDRRSRDAMQMQKHATKAAVHFNTAQQRQRKRKADNKLR